MLKASVLHELLSGRRRGFWAAMLRGLLGGVEIPYAWAMRYRNRRYDRGAAKIQRVPAPVISVGNLTLGGTGKTPLVCWLARWFQEHNIPVAIVSRGYGARARLKGCSLENDEARELATRLPGVPHLQNPDRVASARLAIALYQCRAVILDDAFQHRRIARDLDIVLLDALDPFGLGHVFPRGLLREPVEALRRANLVGLSRADMVDQERRLEIRRQVARLAPAAGWLEMMHRPRCLVAVGGREQPLESLRGLRLAAFCGIGNPAGFRHTLASCGYDLAGFREFPDHHAYTARDMDDLALWATECQASALVCTGKDLAKLTGHESGSMPVWAISIDLEISEGRDVLVEKLDTLLL